MGMLLQLYSMRMLEWQLTSQGEEQHRELARSLSESLREFLLPLVRSGANLGRDELRNRLPVHQLDELLRSHYQGKAFLRLKIYRLDGVTVYSSDADQIGDDQSGNAGIKLAAQDIPVSSFIKRNEVNPFEGEVESRDMIQSYLPLHDESNATAGVFEIYSDFSSLLNRLRTANNWLMLGISGVLGLFYCVMVWLFASIERAGQRQRKARLRHLQDIENNREELKKQVADRTRELEHTSIFLQSVMDSMDDSVIVVDNHFRLHAMNRVAREQLSTLTAPDRHAGSDSQGDILPIDDDIREMLESVMETGTQSTMLHKHLQENGELRQIEARVSPLFDADRQIVGIVEVRRDVTERERNNDLLRHARDEAESASRFKTEYVARLCHEVRTPMNAVLGLADLLSGTALTATQWEYIQGIQSSGDALLTVADNILDFSRLEMGEQNLALHSFDVGELLESVLVIMGHQASSKGLELTMQLDPPVMPGMWGDSDRLRQILINLVSNAVKYTEHGHVALHASMTGETKQKVWLRFEIRDSGIGIDPGIRARLFMPYVQGSNTAGAGCNGAGLGLSISKRIAEIMGGEIGVQSEPGQGSIFWFSIPLETIGNIGNQDYLIHNGLAGKRVLIKALNPELRNMLCRCLSGLAMNCVPVPDHGEALQQLHSTAGTGQAFDCAVIDVTGSGQDWIREVQDLRADPATANLPLLLLSPVSKPLDASVVSTLTHVRCISKPVLPSRLEESMLSLLQVPATQEATSAEPALTSESAARGPARILVAEDNSLNARVLMDMLVSLGYQPDHAADGQAVLAAVASKPYDLVILDCQMPDMGGIDVCREIRGQRDRLPAQPLIIALSADVTVQNKEACLQAGMNDFMGKPFRLGQLAECLERWLPGPAVSASQEPGTQMDSQPSSSGQQMSGEVSGAGGGSGGGRYYTLFLEDARQRIRSISRALEQGDFMMLKKSAHAFKGGCMQLGLQHMVESSEQMEQAATNDDAAAVQRCLELLCSQLAGFERDLVSRASPGGAGSEAQ